MSKATAPIAGAGRPVGAATPSADLRRFLAVLEVVLLEAARRSEDELPGLVITVKSLCITTGAAAPTHLGRFSANIWRRLDDDVADIAEVVLNASHLDQPAHRILCNGLHEVVHAYAAALNLADVSHNGYYHSRKVFRRLAESVGLLVERHPTRGVVTPGLSEVGAQRYADLLSQLGEALSMVRTPAGLHADLRQVDHQATVLERPPKFISARCGCTDNRGRPLPIRVAVGRWAPRSIFCFICDQFFVDPTKSPSPDGRNSEAGLSQEKPSRRINALAIGGSCGDRSDPAKPFPN